MISDQNNDSIENIQITIGRNCIIYWAIILVTGEQGQSEKSHEFIFVIKTRHGDIERRQSGKMLSTTWKLVPAY